MMTSTMAFLMAMIAVIAATTVGAQDVQLVGESALSYVLLWLQNDLLKIGPLLG